MEVSMVCGAGNAYLGKGRGRMVSMKLRDAI